MGPEAGFSPGQWPNVGRALDRQAWDALVPHLTSAGLEPATVMPELRRFCELLLQWNRKVSNLISRNDEARLVARHVAESLAPSAWLKQNPTGDWMDLGSGGGLPAIPLVLAGIGERWVLVESRRTKCLFLRRAVQQLGLENVSVEQARIEDLVGSHGLTSRFQGFTSRATLGLKSTLELAAPLVRSGGSAYLWKGSRLDAEMTEIGPLENEWIHDSTRSVGVEQTVVARFLRR